jgi:type III secretion protein V
MKANIKGGDLAVAVLLVAIVGLMILPLPTFLIDTLLAVNITISLLLLVVTMYMPSAIALSSFPTLLLFTTLFRLSLNIASSKAILLHADAGHLIESFGQLVVGGNLVVGIVVFLIITIVQFIVISKGSERVAEVGARFTLDAMPGKQMSIDADLRAGLLSGEEAKKKRAHLAMESQLHGGMDGAMKFVKGDSIAGLVITVVNIVAGIIVGVSYHGMTSAEAAARFSVLSIGDAMVSQVPSLLICVAAGIMITRVADDSKKDQGDQSVGQEIVSQMGSSASAMYMAGVLVLGFAAIPGFPWPQFLLLSAALLGCGWAIGRRKGGGGVSEPLSALKRLGEKSVGPALLPHAPRVSKPLAVRVSPVLARQLAWAEFNAALERGRAGVEEALGLAFPGMALWIHEPLPESGYDILIHDVPAGAGELRPGPPAPEAAESGAKDGGAMKPEGVLAEHVCRLMRENAHRFVGIQEVQWMLEALGDDYAGLVAELQKVMTLQRIGEVLRRLLEEQIPIRNLRAICESMTYWGAKEKDLIMLCEYVRGDLGAYLAHRATGGTGVLCAIFVDGEVEQAVRESIKQTPAGTYLALPNETTERIVQAVAAHAGEAETPGVAVVVSMDIRRYFRRLVEPRFKWLQVYSFQELGAQVELRPMGRISL